MKMIIPSLATTLFLLGIPYAATAELKVKITPHLSSVDVTHNGQPVTIQRNQDQNNRIDEKYNLTSRPCPRFCIQPAKLAPDVETIAELEVLNFLDKMHQGDTTIMVIDSRTPNWFEKGTIPGSVNIPWTELNEDSGADPFSVSDILVNRFNAVETDTGWDFSTAKTLVLFCNGMWCGQSSNSITDLLNLGYPAEKLKWYRGGMQTWEILGLTTAR